MFRNPSFGTFCDNNHAISTLWFSVKRRWIVKLFIIQLLLSIVKNIQILNIPQNGFAFFQKSLDLLLYNTSLVIFIRMQEASFCIWIPWNEMPFWSDATHLDTETKGCLIARHRHQKKSLGARNPFHLSVSKLRFHCGNDPSLIERKNLNLSLSRGGNWQASAWD